jgi:uncharacterized protein (TIRG00374 family)
MRKILVTILQYVIFFGLGFYIIYHMLHELSAAQESELAEALKNVSIPFLIPIFIIGFLSHFFRALRWRLLLKTIDVNPTIINTSFAVFIGYFINLGIPRAGEVAKCTILAKYEKVPPHKLVGTILAERAWDMVCLLLTWILAISLQASVISDYATNFGHRFMHYVNQHQSAFIALLIVLVVGILTTIIIYQRHKENKIGTFIKEMSQGVSSIIRMKKRGLFLFYTFLIWFMYTLQIYVGFLGLPVLHEYHLTLNAALVVLVYGSIGMIITPGGIGMYTLLVAEILTAYQVKDIPAQAFGWIAWAAQAAIIVILGLTSLALIQNYNNRIHGKTIVDSTPDI